MKIQDISFRPPTPEDKSFILSSWLKSYRQSEFAKHMINDIYFNQHAPLVEAILKRSLVIVACNPETPEQIYGYICFEQIANTTILHYCYVKFPYRKFGIGDALFKFAQPDTSNLTFTSHIPRNSSLIFAKYNLIYDLYKLV